VYNFIIQHMNKISDVKMRLRQETSKKWSKWTLMLSAPDQAEHMKFLVKLTKSKRGLDVGTFTGYSALCFAEAIPEDG
jgi:predicted O-methyltransferase YrrM